MHNGCQVRLHLADEFATAARLYSEAVVALTGNSVSMSRNNYDRLLQDAAKARERSEAARIAFQEHVDWHRCLAEQNMKSLSAPSARRATASWKEDSEEGPPSLLTVSLVCWLTQAFLHRGDKSGQPPSFLTRFYRRLPGKAATFDSMTYSSG